MQPQSSDWAGRFPRNEIISLLDVNRRYNLAESTAADLRFGELLDLIGGESLRDLPLGYGSAAGLEELRRAISQIVGVAPDNILTTNGLELGLALLAVEACSPGDEVVLASPYFPPSHDLFVGTGLTVREVRTDFDRGYRLDLASFEAALSPATRLVSIASPQNPSGVSTSREMFAELLKIMETRAPNALLFIDETYREATYGDAPVPRSAADLDPRVITGSSVSKAHGAPGLRVGWLTIADAQLRERLTIAKMNLVISGSPLNEALAAGLLRQSDKVLGPRRALLGKALPMVAQWQAGEASRLEWVRPDGGALCCVRLNAEAFDDDAVDQFWSLLPRYDLQLGSGTWFGESARIFRLGFGYLPIERLQPALDAISQVMDEVESAGGQSPNG